MDTGLWQIRLLGGQSGSRRGAVVEADLVARSVVEDLDVVEQDGAYFERVNVSIGPQMWRISFFKVTQNASIAALSKQSPTLP